MPKMPIFRIMGGGQPSRASTYPGNRSNVAAGPGGGNTTGAGTNQTTSNSNSQAPINPTLNTVPRGGYPGLRATNPRGPIIGASQPPSAAAAAAPRALPLMPSGPPRVGVLNSTTVSTNNATTSSVNNPAAAVALPSTIADPNVILRGSNIVGSALPAPGSASIPPSASAPSSSTAQQPPSSASAPAPSSSAAAAAAANRGPETTRPGAYAVTRTASGPAQVYRVTVPAGVSPGSEFTVHAGPRRVRVRCPNTSRPGQSLQITLPPEPVTHHAPLKMAPLTAAQGPGRGGSVQMTLEVFNVNRVATESGGTAQTFLVTIPTDIYPGMQFTVDVNGQRFVVTCPPNAGPNMKVRIVPPTQREEPMAAPKTQVFEVAVPPGVGPNEPFALVANGQRVLVTCPPNVTSGQKIRFQLPVQELLGHIQLSYESATGGWVRTIRVTDMKFQWVRVNNNNNNNNNNNSNRHKLHGDDDDDNNPASSSGMHQHVHNHNHENNVEEGDARTATLDVNAMEKFDFKRSAYVRKLTYLEGNDARMRTGTIELVPAKDAVVDSKLVVHNRTLVSYADIAAVQGKSLEEKTLWFHNICNQLTGAWEDGHIKVAIRRKYLLLDSVDAIMSLGRDDLRKRWRFEFLGEPGIDSGGVTREWFQLVTEQIMDPAFGLWKCSVNNQACVTINPSSDISCPDDHLVYFRFLGRVLGRALFDRQIVKGHMARHVFKHLLGWPITFEDLSAQDEEYYQSLKKLADMDDVSAMCLDFTVTEENMGAHSEVELIEGGAMKEVNQSNLVEYLEANLRYQMLDRFKAQMTELLLGFFDIVPEPALTVFDSNELELILCGLPTIEMDDWEANTIYSGVFENKGRQHQAVMWFWETVRDDFDQEMKARLLQFVTGTSGVPSRGFAYLQGNDGNIKKFAIHGMEVGVYPRAHTCFNRIDLPIYESKKELEEKLRASITLSAVGFDME